MQHLNSTKDPLKVNVVAIDLSRVKRKLIQDKNWTPKKADDVEALYKGFFYLAAKHRDQMWVPTEDIDDMWHAHILDTARYMEDCRRIRGDYFHHLPSLEGEESQEAAEQRQFFAATCSAFEAELGIDLRTAAAHCGGGCGGHSCGGHSCSSHSCSGGHHSSCATPPASCTSPSDDKKKRDKAPPSPPKPPPKPPRPDKGRPKHDHWWWPFHGAEMPDRSMYH